MPEEGVLHISLQTVALVAFMYYAPTHGEATKKADAIFYTSLGPALERTMEESNRVVLATTPDAVLREMERGVRSARITISEYWDVEAVRFARLDPALTVCALCVRLATHAVLCGAQRSFRTDFRFEPDARGSRYGLLQRAVRPGHLALSGTLNILGTAISKHAITGKLDLKTIVECLRRYDGLNSSFWDVAASPQEGGRPCLEAVHIVNSTITQLKSRGTDIGDSIVDHPLGYYHIWSTAAHIQADVEGLGNPRRIAQCVAHPSCVACETRKITKTPHPPNPSPLP